MSSLIIGLGNMGPDYEHTRHNIGFDVLEELSTQFSTDSGFEPSRHGDTFRFRTKGRSVTLLKPSTFVSLSGKAVSYWMQKEKVKLEDVLVVTDDLALPFGTLRMRAKGNDGGHNGLKNIDLVLGTSKYARLRFGVGGDFQRGQQIDYVLGQWSDVEKETLAERIEMTGKMILSFCTAGVARTMSDFNNR
ncbi:MAG: aminoacyl-tRNA hydrolase [Flavobacteriales bacterium]|nr:aminoacyl-tRNA hydrolase [Flavobacteriales bacterium]